LKNWSQLQPENHKAIPATSYTPIIQSKARAILEKIYRPGYTFQKVGVMLTDLATPSNRQRSFFDPSPHEKSHHQSLMSVMDSTNNHRLPLVLDTKKGICAGNFFPSDTPHHGPS
jgi:hypothetical protein